MIGHVHRLAFLVGVEQLADVGAPIVVPLGHIQHLVEVTIVQITLIIHAQGIPAHHGFKIVAIVVVAQQLHVIVELVMRQQHRAEAADGHIGDGQQAVEAHAEALVQLAVVVRLQGRLRRRQMGAHRVVDQVQGQRRIAVADRVKAPDRLDAAAVDTLAALLVDVLFQVTGQRRHDLHALLRQEFRQILIAVLQQNGQVADGLTRIPLVSSSIIKFLQYDKYTSENKKAYMIDDYLYIFHAEGMEFVTIRGVFENPEDVAKFDCDGACYDDTSDYPIPMDMLQAINSGIIQGELKLLGITASDSTNDRMPGNQVNMNATNSAALTPKQKPNK